MTCFVVVFRGILWLDSESVLIVSETRLSEGVDGSYREALLVSLCQVHVPEPPVRWLKETK